MFSDKIAAENEYGLAEAAILSEQWLSATTLVSATMEQPTSVVIRKQRSGLTVEISAKRSMSPTFPKGVHAVADLLSLKPGWNSYSAKAIDHYCATQAIRLLDQFLEPSTPPPSVVPTVRGGIQLEWHTGGVDIEIYIEPPNELSFFAEDAVSGKSSDLSLAGHEGILKSWLARLSGK